MVAPAALPRYNGKAMERHIHEADGVLFEVLFALDPDNVPCIASIRVIDAGYQPVGPNLATLLHSCLVMTSYDECIPFLSRIAEEIHVSRHSIVPRDAD